MSGLHVRSRTFSDFGTLRDNRIIPDTVLLLSQQQQNTRIVPTVINQQYIYIFKLILFEIILTLGYGAYRGLLCNSWECQPKTYQDNYDDLTTLCAIGGIIFATGFTLPEYNESLTYYILTFGIFVSSLIGFGAIGQLTFLQTSLVTTTSWKMPAVIFYVVGILIIVGTVGYSYNATNSRRDKNIFIFILIIILGIYLAAVLFALAAGVYGTDIPFHPHHWQIGWHVTILIRGIKDRKITILFRWIFIGVFVQGLAAYSAASILSSGIVP